MYKPNRHPLTHTDLSLVEGGALARPAKNRVPSLASQPFRPGELPAIVPIEVDSAVRSTAAQAAVARRLPIELWIRLAVDGWRHANYAAAATDVSLDQLADWCDQRAAGADQPPLVVTGRLHQAYARLIDEGDATATPRRATSRIHLLLPDVVLSGWSVGAAAAGVDLSTYVSRALEQAPDGVASWEAAAAARGLSLGEWIWQSTVHYLTAR